MAVKWLKRRIARVGTSDRGAVMVEFVVVLPLLMTILFLYISVGQSLFYHHVITSGVWDGVRYLSRAPLDATFIDNAKRIAMTGSASGSDPAFVFWNEMNTINVTTTDVAHGGAFRGPDPLVMIRMTATVDVDIPFFTFFGLGTPVTLIVSDEIRHIGE